MTQSAAGEAAWWTVAAVGSGCGDDAEDGFAVAFEFDGANAGDGAQFGIAARAAGGDLGQGGVREDDIGRDTGGLGGRCPPSAQRFEEFASGRVERGSSCRLRP